MNGNSNRTNTQGAFFFLLAVAGMLALMLIPLPQHIRVVGSAKLSSAGQTSMAILLFALVLWMTEAVPFHITGLMSMVLLTVFHVGTFQKIVQVGFGNHIFLFFLGVLILSSFVTRSGLGGRVSVFLLSKTGNRTSIIILGFLIAGTLLSMWLTNMAVAAMLMPLARSILMEEGVKPLKSNFGKALMIAAAWGPIIGGIATPAGAGPNPLAIGFLKEMAGVTIQFTEWMKYGVPAALLLVLPAWGILMLFFPPEIKRLAKTREELKAEQKAYPPMAREEIITLVIFLFTVLLWVITPLLQRLLGIQIPISLPILFASTLFFLPLVSGIKWRTIEKEMAWDGIILVVSGISLGMMLYDSGAANWLAVVLLGGIGTVGPFVKVFAVVIIVSFLKIGFSSNTVTATIIIPIMIALAKTLHIHTMTVALPAAITSSLAFILVTSSPTNVIPYSAGYFAIKDMAISGVVLTIIASFIVAGTIFIVGSMSGLY